MDLDFYIRTFCKIISFIGTVEVNTVSSLFIQSNYNIRHYVQGEQSLNSMVS